MDLNREKISDLERELEQICNEFPLKKSLYYSKKDELRQVTDGLKDQTELYNTLFKRV